VASPGLIVAGDFALATGADQHVAFVASILARSNQALAWAWFVPADRVQIAAALHEAWQRPHPVACFGGLGSGIDDRVRATVASLQAGREAVGLSRHAESGDNDTFSCGNITFFGGNPKISHAVFERWFDARLSFQAASQEATATERVRWELPESAAASNARRLAKQAFPAVAQRLIAGADGEVALIFEGPSKGKTQSARKVLQRELRRD